jgi:hypothetical protein
MVSSERLPPMLPPLRPDLAHGLAEEWLGFFASMAS